MTQFPWNVKKVETFPECYKVYPIAIYKETNDTSNYFKVKADAENEAAKRNIEHNRLNENNRL